MKPIKLNNWVYCEGKIYGESITNRIIVTPHILSTEATSEGTLAHTKSESFLLGDCRESDSTIVIIPEKVLPVYIRVVEPLLEEALPDEVA